MMKIDAIIIGAGACGLMCAVQAGYLGKKVLVIEKNDKVGAKILISGGGRCNYTNLYTTAEQYISSNPHFCKSALSQWTVADTLQFFESFGIEGQEKTLGQMFPTSNKAKDIVKVFEQQCADLGQEIWLNSEVLHIEKQEDIYMLKVQTEFDTVIISSPKVVFATGGLPIPKMGATDFALRWAQQFGHTIVETAPALVPLTITGKDEEWFAQLSGNSVFCTLTYENQQFTENILFTHWGLSGPAVLQISSYWRRGQTIEIDFLPNQSVLEALQTQKKQQGSLTLQSFLHQWYSKKLVEAFQKYIPIHKNIASLSNDDLSQVEAFIHRFKVKPAGDKGYAKAEVMRGGINTNEISSKSLESKLQSGMYFGGECIDVTGWLGGYNFQWAWASGYVIANAI